MATKSLNLNPEKKKKSWRTKITGIVSSGIVIFFQKSWKGATIGGALAFIFYLIVFGLGIKTGISPIFDFFLIVIIVILVCGLAFFICHWLFNIVKNFNPIFVSMLLTSYIVSVCILDNSFLQYFILFELVCGCLIAFALSCNIKKFISIPLITIAVVANIFVFYILIRNVGDKTIEVTDEYWSQNIVQPTKASFTDPSANGSYVTKTLFYGSGKDKYRTEFGKNADIITDSVDATPFFDKTSGLGNKLRKLYWGFNAKNYPINGRVWYPDGEGSFPLVLIVHGNHSMQDFSDPGYDYLGELLASKGYILVSIDENFINGGWMGDYQQDENFTRGWLMLKHLENWRAWNKDSTNVFYNKVDMDNISLIGHSRGGAAVVVAAEINKLERYQVDAKQKFDFNFSIKSIVQIAPVDTYNPKKEVPLVVKDIDYLLLHGGYDEDVYWFTGNRTYNRMKFTDGDYHFKSAIFIYRANHAYFNTSWDKDFKKFPGSWFINMNSIMNGDDQRQVAKSYIAAFLDITLKGKKEYMPIMKDYRYARKFLPKDYYFNQFEDPEFKYIADFEEDFDVTTASIAGCKTEGENLKTWKENSLTFRNNNASSQHNAGVYLGWDKTDTTITGAAQYTVTITNSTLKKLNVDLPENLFFFICNNDDKLDTVNFTIELATHATSVKKEFNDFIILPPALKIKLSKCNFIKGIGNDDSFERVLQYVKLPFDAFKKEDENFNPMEIEQIRFIFDKTNKGEIIIDKIGVN
ncbi:MAG: alpha/beta hydrolase [Prevotellaceae bacterium]|jgi:dienelactone hydrolase|nr:alpha/beta hydrolase [Prevotellaceae bacterium]